MPSRVATILVFSVALLTLAAGAAAAQERAAPSQEHPAPTAETQAPLRRSVFTGNEMRMATFSVLNADCTSGPRPDVRIVTPPANGTVHFDAVVAAVDRPAGDPRVQCNGKRADSVAIFYRARKGFVGEDAVVIEIDFKNGFTRRFAYAIDVR